MKDYVPLREVVKLLGLQPNTIRKWGRQGLVDVIKTPTGQQLYCKHSIQALLDGHPNGLPLLQQERQNILYCRVSSKKQQEDLARQIAHLRSVYPDYTVMEDIGSGINWKRPGLKTVLELAMQQRIGNIVVAHRDRLCRFGFDLFEQVIRHGGGKIIVLDEPIHRSSEQELAEDILSILHVYSCKQMGQRRYTKSDQKDQVVPNLESEEPPQEMVRDGKVCVE
jgi:putative resolvase